MNTKILTLYEKWKQEFNKGHNKEFLSDWPDDPMELFGNQDQVVEMYQQVFDHYKIPFKGNILDAGCSMGGLLFSLRKIKSFSFIGGFDIDATAIKMANSYKEINGVGNIEIKNGSALKIPFASNTFDIIIFKDIAEHLENQENLKKALSECYRTLKKGGILFLEAPNYYFPYEPHLKMIKLPYYSSKKSVRLLSKLFKRNSEFVDQLNFTTPKLIKKLLKKEKFVDIIDIYDDYRVEWKFNAGKETGTGNRKLDFVMSIIYKFKLEKLAILVIRKTKMYPILWFISKKV